MTMRYPPIVAASLVLFGCLSTGFAQEAEDHSEARYFLLPVEIDADSGAANGDAIISRLIPAFSIPLSDKLRLMNLALVTIADAPGGVPGRPGNPEPVPGPNVFGLGDVLDAAMLTPAQLRAFSWGVGVGLGIPTATAEELGSGKWSAGPAMRLAYRPTSWILSLLATNRWSFAGDSDRVETNQLLVRLLVRRELGERWFFLYSPIITANWKADSDQRWLVPLGGGFGYGFHVGSTTMNVSLQAYSNVVRPDGAPHSVYRLEIVFPFRLQQRN